MRYSLEYTLMCIRNDRGHRMEPCGTLAHNNRILGLFLRADYGL